MSKMTPMPLQRTESRRSYKFGTVELDTARFELRRDGVPIRLEKIPMELLILLVERRGELVTRQEILEQVWGPDVFVDAENGINTAIRKIRIAISTAGSEPKDAVQTVIGKGYRISIPIETVSAPILPDHLSPLKRRTRLIWAGTAVLLILLGTGLALYLHAPSHIRITSIAVLPLDNFSGDPKDDYFADGITEAIITRVAQIGGFKVISRSSVMRFKGKLRDIREIARELNVDAVLEGSVIRQRSRVRVTAQLIDARTDRHLWTEQYDRDSSEILQLQDDVARRIAQSVGTAMSSGDEPPRSSTERLDPGAYDNYLRARALSQQRTPTALAKAIELYQAVLQLQPRYAEAYAGLSDAYAALGYNSFVPPQESFPKAKAAATKALEFNPRSAEAHAALGYTFFYFDWDITAAQEEFEAALKANSNHAVSHHWRSVLLTSQAHYDEAEREIALARSLDPLSMPIDADIGFELYYAGRYDDAIRHLTNLTTLAPNFAPAHLWLGRAFEQKEMYPQSVLELERANDLVPDWSVIIGALGHARAAAGDRAGARRELERLDALSKARFVTPYAVALVYAGLNDQRNALRWLERAYAERSHWLIWLPTDPRFSNLRNTRGFLDLVARVRRPSLEATPK